MKNNPRFSARQRQVVGETPTQQDLTRFLSDQCSALFVTPVRLASIVCVCVCAHCFPHKVCVCHMPHCSGLILSNMCVPRPPVH